MHVIRYWQNLKAGCGQGARWAAGRTLITQNHSLPNNLTFCHLVSLSADLWAINPLLAGAKTPQPPPKWTFAEATAATWGSAAELGNHLPQSGVVPLSAKS